MTYATTGNASLFRPLIDEDPFDLDGLMDIDFVEAFGICVEQPSARERELHKRTPAPQPRPGVMTTHGGDHE